jgi:predicted small secreted protein
MKRLAIAALVLGALILGACDTSADVASANLSKAAEEFEIDRRVVFFNGITDTYMLTIEGRCSIEDQTNQLEVTCKVGDGAFKKHFLGLSDNVTYFVEQLESADVSVYHYRVIFRPQIIIPDIDPEVSVGG